MGESHGDGELTPPGIPAQMMRRGFSCPGLRGSEDPEPRRHRAELSQSCFSVRSHVDYRFSGRSRSAPPRWVSRRYMLISQITLVASVVGVASLAALAIAVASLRKLRSTHRQALARMDALEEQLASAKIATRSDREREFFFQFAREFPHMTQELHSEVDVREIPAALNKILLRTFEPWQSVVLIRRRRVATDNARDGKLVVASVARPDGAIQAGMEVPLNEGEIGVAVKTHQVLSRDDFQKLAVHARAKLKQESIRGFEADLVAPMVFRDDTLGVLALARPNLFTEGAKAVLRLIAHMGAMSLHHSRAYRDMKVTAEIDGLTGLYNKSYISVALGEKILEAEELGASVSILLLDIDNFKNYNDTNGHDAGDRLLREFSQLLSDNVRETDVVGRFGGEEFLLIFPGATPSQALSAAEKMRRKIAEQAFPHRERQPLGFVSFSGGVASYPGHCLGSAALVRAADRALYRAKAAGRNRVLEAEQQTFGERAVETDAGLVASALEDEPSREKT